MYETRMKAAAPRVTGHLVGSTEPKGDSAFQSLTFALRNHVERVAALRERMCTLKDRAFGSEPQADSAGKEIGSVPNGALDAVRREMENLGSAIEDCHRLMNRFENIV